jgi:ribosomal protein S24E
MIPLNFKESDYLTLEETRREISKLYSHESNELFSNSDILKDLYEATGEQFRPVIIGRAFSSLGFKRAIVNVKGKTIRGVYLKMI